MGQSKNELDQLSNSVGNSTRMDSLLLESHGCFRGCTTNYGLNQQGVKTK
jgi:hypothetical protein